MEDMDGIVNGAGPIDIAVADDMELWDRFNGAGRREENDVEDV